jgi:hypothetical protein
MATVFDEKWGKWVALTTMCLAVCAAISSLKGGGYSTKVQLLTTAENNKWAYFQSKSIKQHSYELQRDIFALYQLNAGEKEKDFINKKIKYYTDEVARYDKEKNDIKKEAEDLSKSEDNFKRHGGNFGMAVMFLQIAIMLSSVAALIKRRRLWTAGLAMGVLGLAYMLNGFYLWF